jgi:hypothetical protein
MATYKGIQGFTIQNLSADPSNPIEGQVWYNSTSNVWKVEEATTVGAWATGGNFKHSKKSLLLKCRYSNCRFSFWRKPTPSVTGVTEEYNGTSWTTSPGSLSTARNSLAGFGIQTAALAVGGNIPPSTIQQQQKNMNGSTWTRRKFMNTARFNCRSRNSNCWVSFWWFSYCWNMIRQ